MTTAKMTNWITHADAMKRFFANVDHRVVRSLMDFTPEDESVVWVNKGSQLQPYYLWDEARCDAWFRKAMKCRASRPASRERPVAENTSSGGATPTAAHERRVSTTRRKRKRSSASSTTASPAGGATNPVTLARSLLSKRPSKRASSTSQASGEIAP